MYLTYTLHLELDKETCDSQKSVGFINNVLSYVRL
jgi:hypothetical protein